MEKPVKNKILFLGCGLLLISFSCTTKVKVNETPPPNIVYILADDLGYGDLCFLSQKSFQTPNIDQLAREGMLFTQHYSGSTVCAPSRSSLMTGQHTGHTFIRGNKEVLPEGQHPLEASAITLAEVLKEAGFVTGAFGKWGRVIPAQRATQTTRVLMSILASIASVYGQLLSVSCVA